MQFTTNQQKAIDDKSGTLLISAGAGSGKTAVLTERICRRIADPKYGHDISEYLIVTFTKAATLELRSRLTKKLTETVNADPSNRHALRQLTRMGLAKICTIHSFCLELIKSNFQILGLSSKIRMADEAEAEILCASILDNILEEKYSASAQKENNDPFIISAQVFAGAKNDDAFAQTILSLYKFIRTLPNPISYLEKSISHYEEISKNDEFFSTYFGQNCKQLVASEASEILMNLQYALDEISLDEVLSKCYGPAFESDCSEISRLINAIEAGDFALSAEVCASLNKQSLKAVRNCENPVIKETVSDIRKSCWKKVESLQKKYLSCDASHIKSAAGACKIIIEALYEIICELDNQYSASKREKGILDYSDLEHMALSLLVEFDGENAKPTMLAKKYSESFAEIYIDEYQDINPLQDMIFKAICKYAPTEANKTLCECNRFLVGDLKQSIYRFRGAKPEIFFDYTEQFCHIDSENASKTFAHKLYLSNNFRCAKNVINLVNATFSGLMPEYTQEENLIFSRIEEKSVSAPCELILLYDNGEPSADNDEANAAEELDSEALYIAKRLKEIVGNPEYVDSNGQMYSYGDCAVLIRNANSVSRSYRRTFEIAGVPLSSDAPDDFFTKPEVLLALCLFNTIDNPERDIYTAGLMRSKLFGFGDDELTEIRMHSRSTSFWGCVCAFADCEKDTHLGSKVNAFVEKIGQYRALSRGMATDRLITFLYDDTGLLNICSAENEQAGENLVALYEYARKFEKTSFRGLSSYLAFLEDMDKVGTSSRVQGKADAVTLMSIHRSKGLEFPVCFVASLGKNFNTDDDKKRLVTSDVAGIGIKLKNYPGNDFYPTDNGYVSIDTPFRQAVINIERHAMAQEEKRLLYVAMTRARDRLIMTASGKAIASSLQSANIARLSEKTSYFIESATNFISFLFATCPEKTFNSIFESFSLIDAGEQPKNICCTDEDYIKVSLYPKEVDAGNSSIKRKTEISDKIEIDENKVSDYLAFIKQSVSFNYGEASLRIPAKISVSDLKYGLLDSLVAESIPGEPAAEMGYNTENIKEMPEFMLEKKTSASGAEKGTALHVFMQFCNYRACADGQVSQEADRLLKNRFISPRQRELIDEQRISAFFSGSLYREVIAKADHIYRERRFNLSLEANELNPKLPQNQSILIQGVIDCFCLNSDGTYTLIDFKSDALSGKNPENLLIRRHELQMSIYKRAIEEMTEGRVKSSYIYSFTMNKEILL